MAISNEELERRTESLLDIMSEVTDMNGRLIDLLKKQNERINMLEGDVADMKIVIMCLDKKIENK